MIGMSNKRPIPSYLLVLCVAVICGGWVGVDVRPLRKTQSELETGKSGSYYQLSDNERKELVWMAQAAKSAYSDGKKPLGYRSFTKAEWEQCSVGCTEIRYEEDGSFKVGSGLRGRLMVNMVNEGRVVLALCGVDDLNIDGQISASDIKNSKDVRTCVEHYLSVSSPQQYEQALCLLQGVLNCRPRSHLWIVGHSLGGGLTTYLALEIPSSRTNVKCATFNGYGYSPNLQVSEEKIVLAKSRLRNVYADGDPIYNWKLSRLAQGVPMVSLIDKLAPPRHFGPEYSLVGEGDALAQHSLDGLLDLMIVHRTKWPGL